ncbi:kinase-like protein [Sporormia fimetaria CBS 119925]|uniref:non-specific serine/threonine protein kinase n=1 Tax=Sporormia fimetaria CBS 119925 TaxID=1340428 RepID=A0A6A6UZV4_9PLEO|nr:kinase-like protein [Sporormia fimetaria CBS 119925]
MQQINLPWETYPTRELTWEEKRRRLLRWLKIVVTRRGWAPLDFPTTGFAIIADDRIVDEEILDEFREGLFCPIAIGEVVGDKYQIVRKLGYGKSSTVWLARNLHARLQYRTLKVHVRGATLREYFIHKELHKASHFHPGKLHVRKVDQRFTIRKSEGSFGCLVMKPMICTVSDALRAFTASSNGRPFPLVYCKQILYQLLLALDYLHWDRKLVHTDIKADNLFYELRGKTSLDAYALTNYRTPASRKVVNGRTIYRSRCLQGTAGRVVLGDLGVAKPRIPIIRNFGRAQPCIFQAPEVLFDIAWD